MAEKRRAQSELFPRGTHRQPELFPTPTQVSKTVGNYQRILEKRRETAAFLDELKTVTRILRREPPTKRNRRRYLEYWRAHARNAVLTSELQRRGFSRERIESELCKRTPRTVEFNNAVRRKVEEFASASEENRRIVEGKMREVRGWNFVNPRDENDVLFHTLIEIARHRAEKRIR